MKTICVCETHSSAHIYEYEVARRWYALPAGVFLPLSNGDFCQLLFAGQPGSAAGPDVQDAVLHFSQSAVHAVGDIEFHVRASDWFAHQHHKDARYNNVLLHVVLICDTSAPILRQDGSPIPMCSLYDLALPHLPISQTSWPCHAVLPYMSHTELFSLLTQAGMLRFEQKAHAFVEQLHTAHVHVPIEFIRNRQGPDPHMPECQEPDPHKGECQGPDPHKGGHYMLSPDPCMPECQGPDPHKGGHYMLGCEPHMPPEQYKGNECERDKPDPRKGDEPERQGPDPHKGDEPERQGPDPHKGGHYISHTPSERFPNKPFSAYDVCLIVALAEGLGYGRNRAFFRATGQYLLGLVDSVPEPLGHTFDPPYLDASRLAILRKLVEQWRTMSAWEMVREILLNRVSSLHPLDSLRAIFTGMGKARADILICNVVLPFAMAVGLIENDNVLVGQAQTLYQTYPSLSSNRVTRAMFVQLQLPNEPPGACQQQGLHYIYQQTCKEKRCEECIVGRRQL